MAEFILLDRDGVLNVDLPGSVCRLEEMTMIPGAAEAVALLNAKGYRVLVITNQACVGRGELSRSLLDLIHARMDEAIASHGGRIDGWFVCPHRADENCLCRKPNPGLLRQARESFGFVPEHTRFVGDAPRDVEAARIFGCTPVLVRTGKGEEAARRYPQVECYQDLLDFANGIKPSRDQPQ